MTKFLFVLLRQPRHFQQMTQALAGTFNMRRPLQALRIILRFNLSITVSWMNSELVTHIRQLQVLVLTTPSLGTQTEDPL